MNSRIQRRDAAESYSQDSLSRVLQRVYAARGVRSEEDLNLRLDQLLPYNNIKGIDEAVACLHNALVNQLKVLVVGDYDADGATSTALLIRVLRQFGLNNIDYLVPNRFEYGYGLSEALVEVARQYHPDLIVTVDNGIASIAGVRRARDMGIDVMVTDHHLPGDQLPDANVIVNPNQGGCLFPCKSLAGVGVVFYILLALRARLRDLSWFETNSIAEPNFADHLDIVALGTVADVVPLDKNNRILVQNGIQRIRSGVMKEGIRALLSVARRDYRYLKSSDFGFAIGPRLNAAGRLDDMSLGIECLLTDDAHEAKLLAEELDSMNRERQQISKSMQTEAESMLKDIQDDPVPPAYCLYREDWHEGVTGILAGKLKDNTHRPVIIFAQGGDQQMKGSARSIPGFHMRDALADIAAQFPQLITKFGGHAMAAGLTISVDHYQQFSEEFLNYANKQLDESMKTALVLSDGFLHEDEFTLDIAQQLENGGPWGQAFPEPRFDGEFHVVERKTIGSDHQHLKLVMRYGSLELDAVAFFMTEKEWPQEWQHVHIVYELNINRFRNMDNIQLIIHHVELINSE